MSMEVLVVNVRMVGECVLAVLSEDVIFDVLHLRKVLRQRVHIIFAVIDKLDPHQICALSG